MLYRVFDWIEDRIETVIAILLVWLVVSFLVFRVTPAATPTPWSVQNEERTAGFMTDRDFQEAIKGIQNVQ